MTPPVTIVEERVGGLLVRLVALPWARSVGGCLAVDCGSRDDGTAPASTAHLAEHVRVAAGAAGGRRAGPVFAQTDVARTYFRATAAPEDATEMARGLLDILGDASVDERALEAERAAVELETARMDAGPLLRAGGLFAAAAADEPGMDAVARTTRADIHEVTHQQVADLVAWGYRAPNSVLALAGPPHALAAVPRALADRLTAGPPAAAPADRPLVCHPPMRLPALDGILAVTLTRPRANEDPLHRALLSDRGPLVAAGADCGVGLLGRTTVDNATQAVDVLCWRPAAALERLSDRLRAVCADPVRFSGPELVARVTRAARQQEAFATFTPMARALSAALATAPDPSASSPGRLAVWHVVDGVPVAVG
ncbi:peptidase M16 family protein [Kitasatospora mediocidica]|uniref:insulinase family protein n=1 Tax=Kitasatospora mediocidica TaxID=58352 RepID=UPI000569AA03|nr:insulinase family protein [Kitasatospora mediocidica]